MKRSKFDRFIADPAGHEQDVSAEVYVTVTDEGRRAVLISWRYLALAIALFATAAAVLVTSLKTGERRGHSSSARLTSVPRAARSTQVPPAASTSASSCVEAGGYGGLGARVSAFDANNNDSTGPAQPSPGTAFYVVTATGRGCVTAFAVQDSTTPPLTARDLLVLVIHPFLPRGRQASRDHGWLHRVEEPSGRVRDRASICTGRRRLPKPEAIQGRPRSQRHPTRPREQV
jgi:hypothetical protein